MTRKEMLRRSALICCHCIRNIAYYRAGWKDGDLINKTQYGATLNSNFIDIGLLEWCKIFGSNKEQHHWKKMLANQSIFKANMLKDTGITEKQLSAHWKKVTTYRNKFIAHLDTRKIMYIPKLELIIKTTLYYYSYIQEHHNKDNILHGLPNDLQKYYDECLKEAG